MTPQFNLSRSSRAITGHNFQPSELADLRFHSKDLADRFFDTYRRVTLHYNCTINRENYERESQGTRNLLHKVARRTISAVALQDVPSEWDPHQWNLFHFFDLNLSLLQDLLHYLEHEFRAEKVNLAGRIEGPGALEDKTYLPKIHEARHGLRKCFEWLGHTVTKEKMANTNLARMHADALIHYLELMEKGIIECRIAVYEVVFFKEDTTKVDILVNRILAGNIPISTEDDQEAAQDTDMMDVLQSMAQELEGNAGYAAEPNGAPNGTGNRPTLDENNEQAYPGHANFCCDMKPDLHTTVEQPHRVTTGSPSYEEHSRQGSEKSLADKDTAELLRELSKGLILDTAMRDDFCMRMKSFDSRDKYFEGMKELILEQGGMKQMSRIEVEKVQLPASGGVKLADNTMRAHHHHHGPRHRHVLCPRHMALVSQDKTLMQPVEADVRPSENTGSCVSSVSPGSSAKNISTPLDEPSTVESEVQYTPPPGLPPGLEEFAIPSRRSRPPATQDLNRLPRFKDDPHPDSSLATGVSRPPVTNDVFKIDPFPPPKPAETPAIQDSQSKNEMTLEQKLVVRYMNQIEEHEKLKTYYRALFPSQSKGQSVETRQEVTEASACIDMTGWTPEKKAAYRAREKARAREEQKKEKRKQKKGSAGGKKKDKEALSSSTTNTTNNKNGDEASKVSEGVHMSRVGHVNLVGGKKRKIDRSPMEARQLEDPLVPAVLESLRALHVVEKIEKLASLEKAVMKGIAVKEANEAKEAT